MSKIVGPLLGLYLNLFRFQVWLTSSRWSWRYSVVSFLNSPTTIIWTTLLCDLFRWFVRYTKTRYPAGSHFFFTGRGFVFLTSVVDFGTSGPVSTCILYDDVGSWDSRYVYYLRVLLSPVHRQVLSVSSLLSYRSHPSHTTDSMYFCTSMNYLGSSSYPPVDSFYDELDKLLL